MGYMLTYVAIPTVHMMKWYVYLQSRQGHHSVHSASYAVHLDSLSGV